MRRPGDYLPWSLAWEQSQYGPGGFYRTQQPHDHFATAGDNPSVVRALLALAVDTDEALGQPSTFELWDVGAGDGRLVEGIVREARRAHPAFAARLSATAVDVRTRPDSLDQRIAWIQGAAPSVLPQHMTGLVVGHEWLDDLPVDIVQSDDHGQLREVVVRPQNGDECLGQAIDDDTPVARWLKRWGGGPPTEATTASRRVQGERYEIGHQRDMAWAETVSRVDAGRAVAIDYASTAAGTATLDAFRQGRRVDPLPDGSCNLTAHVRLDACADAAIERVTGLSRGIQTVSISQAEVVERLDPPAAAIHSTPMDTLVALADTAARSAATRRGAWGDHVWLVHAIGIPLPSTLVADHEDR